MIREHEVAQSHLTLCNPMDCSLPGSSVHGIFQAIVLEWIAISFSKGSSQPRDRTWVSRIVDRRFTVWATREVGSPCEWRGGACHCSRVMVGESGLETCWRRSLEVYLGLRQETLASLDLCRWPQGASHGGSEKSGKLELGGASRDSSGFGALEDGLIFSWGRNLRVPLI